MWNSLQVLDESMGLLDDRSAFEEILGEFGSELECSGIAKKSDLTSLLATSPVQLAVRPVLQVISQLLFNLKLSAKFFNLLDKFYLVCPTKALHSFCAERFREYAATMRYLFGFLFPSAKGDS